MEKFVRSLVTSDCVHSYRKLLANVDFSVETSIVKFIQKVIFKQDVLVEWKTILTLMSSSENFTIKSDVIKKTASELINLLSSKLDEKEKSNGFCYIFQAFSSSFRKEECTIVMKFFIFLCHILGMSELLKPDEGGTDEGLPLINNKTFESAFEGIVQITCISLSYS